MAKELHRLIGNVSWKGMLNKYTVTLLAFSVWMIFFDKYKISSSIYLSKTVTKLEKSKQDYDQLLEEALVERQQLVENSEKYAREKFYMHKADEEVFIIEK